MPSFKLHRWSTYPPNVKENQMVNKPLIRTYFGGGYVRGDRLTSHDCLFLCLVICQSLDIQKFLLRIYIGLMSRVSTFYIIPSIHSKTIRINIKYPWNPGNC